MSHTTEVKTEFKDNDALAKAVAEVGGSLSLNQNVRLYDGTEITGCTRIDLPGWEYPAAVKDDTLYYDTYNGRWGDEALLGKLKQHYGREVLVKTGRMQGFTIVEQRVDGRVRLRMRR